MLGMESDPVAVKSYGSATRWVRRNLVRLVNVLLLPFGNHCEGGHPFQTFEKRP